MRTARYRALALALPALTGGGRRLSLKPVAACRNPDCVGVLHSIAVLWPTPLHQCNGDPGGCSPPVSTGLLVLLLSPSRHSGRGCAVLRE